MSLLEKFGSFDIDPQKDETLDSKGNSSNSKFESICPLTLKIF
jgi:hypothetical protein